MSADDVVDVMDDVADTCAPPVPTDVHRPASSTVWRHVRFCGGYGSCRMAEQQEIGETLAQGFGDPLGLDDDADLERQLAEIEEEELDMQLAGVQVPMAQLASRPGVVRLPWLNGKFLSEPTRRAELAASE